MSFVWRSRIALERTRASFKNVLLAIVVSFRTALVVGIVKLVVDPGQIGACQIDQRNGTRITAEKIPHRKGILGIDK